MSPATEKVFATPELLEMILLFTFYIVDHRYPSWPISVQSKRLFRFQTVSNAFKNTIAGSILPRRAMQLEHRPGVADTLYQEVAITKKFLYAYVELPEQFVKNTDVFMKHHSYFDKTKADDIHVKIGIYYWNNDPNHVFHRNYDKAYIKPDNPVEGRIRPSWHRMKLCRYKVPIQVNVKEYTRRDGYPSFTRLILSYQTESGTYGELMDVVEDALPMLKMEYHERLALQYREWRQFAEVEFHEAEVLQLRATWCDD